MESHKKAEYSTCCYVCNIWFVSFLMATEGKMLILVPSNFHLIWAACHRQTGGFKPIIGLSPGYGACPHIPDIPLILHLCCVPAAPQQGGYCVFLVIVTKGCEWLQGTALRCPALTFSTSPLFNSLTSGLTRTDRLPIHPLSVPRSPLLQPQCILSEAPSTLKQHRSSHRTSHRRFRINSCLPFDKVASLALCCHPLFIPFLQTTLCPTL